MNKKTLFLICTCLLAINLQATVRYVTTDGTATAADATSWTTACSDLQAVIDISEANDEIWVAAGTYKPKYKIADTDFSDNPTTDRDRAFILKKDVKIYGSFEGMETMLKQRQLSDSGNYTSILSGDFDGNDGADVINMGENAHHVVISIGNVGTACLDGFTITGGNANGYGSIHVKGEFISRGHGGGIFNTKSSPVLTNININGNAASFGGGIYSNRLSSLVLTNVIISGNRAEYSGGGMSNGGGSPVLTNVIISKNMAIGQDGGGMSNGGDSSPILTNVIISENTAPEGGGISNYNSPVILTNVIISRNRAGQGGGVLNCGPHASPVFTNVSICGNIAGAGGGMYNKESSFPEICNSIIWGNGNDSNNVNNNNSAPIYRYSLIEGIKIGGVVLEDENPLFVDAANGDFRLQAGSPCIDAGNNEIYLLVRQLSNFDEEKDLAGKPRLYGNNIDLGAYEYQGEPLSTKTLSEPNKNKIYLDATNQVIVIDATLQNQLITFELIDLQGNIILKKANVGESISIAYLPSGIYLCRVLQNGRIIYSDKILKK